MDEKPKIKLRPTEGVVDYATEYKKAITDKNQLINSAKYFLKMRTSHLTEVLGTWEDIVDDMDLEIAELVLNEFLSPKCTLLEFEFKNLTVAGRKIAATIPEEGTPEKAFSEVWQQHILGKVLTNENVSTVSIPEIETTQAGDKTDVTKKAETTSAEKEGKSDKDNEKKEVKEEVDEKKDGLTDSDDNKEAKTVNAELKVEKNKKQEIAMGILVFDRAFSITWKVVNCLVYMEILENVRKDWAGPVATVFGRVHKMLVEENMGIFTEDSADLLKCAHLFILRYRGELDEDLLFRLGFGYLSKKLHILKRDNTNAMAILNVASHMADQELKITEVHKLLEEVFNFDILQL
ncbi:Protein CBG27730 [Caenorhabditis briggsae]|uniref:Protein CBG27730 n=1 Tax=Caenorhabditis briggsae TaxID=6238 RepID=B6IJ28_CAEBR|nr:Protein CBG27730 [Caenorhabditis briggsae]CAS00008.1 Protein CBG27730 [Caenorhabditis briggsae]